MLIRMSKCFLWGSQPKDIIGDIPAPHCLSSIVGIDLELREFMGCTSLLMKTGKGGIKLHDQTLAQSGLQCQLSKLTWPESREEHQMLMRLVLP